MLHRMKEGDCEAQPARTLIFLWSGNARVSADGIVRKREEHNLSVPNTNFRSKERSCCCLLIFFRLLLYSVVVSAKIRG